MGSYTFKWQHPAEDVHVTGTFDNWTKSIKLDKEGDVFTKTVEFKEPAEKVYYKYVVDNNWVVNDSSPKEADHEGNVNNFLTIADYVPVASTAVINNVAPGATTLQKAGEQPIESKEVAEEPTETKEAAATPSEIPGGFPVTPANELDQTISVNPIANELEQSISVNPLPAADGAVNPIKLAPGEEVPKDLKTQDINEHVHYDKESYEKSDTLAGVDLNLPPASETTIPETGFAITKEKENTENTEKADKTGEEAIFSTVGAGATTAALAGLVPKEPKQAVVPEIVKESQEKADVPPEASAEPQEVAEKVKVEEELKEKVPEVPATSTGTSGFGTEKSAETTTLAAAVAAVGGAITTAALTAKDTVTEKAAPAIQQATEVANNNLPDTVKEQLPVSVQETLAGQSKEETREELVPDIPEEVKQSIIEANEPPEAAANTTAVEEKKAVEKELLEEVKKVPAESEAKEEAKQEEVKQEEVKQEEVKQEEVKQDSPAVVETAPADSNGSAPANGSNGHSNGAAATSTKPAPSTESSTKAATTPPTPETKKRHRVSGFFNKLKHKLSDKN